MKCVLRAGNVLCLSQWRYGSFSETSRIAAYPQPTPPATGPALHDTPVRDGVATPPQLMGTLASDVDARCATRP